MPAPDEFQENIPLATGQADNGSQPNPRRRPLTRERIVEAALRILDEEGLEAVTMRRVGRELGVEAMSLYNHVEDKEAILEGVTELVMSEFAFPEPSGEWVETARKGARAWRDLFRKHPNVIQLMAERKHPLTSVGALLPMEAALQILRSAGLSDQETVQAFRALGGYLMGSVILESGGMIAGSETGPSPEELAKMLPPDELPNFISLLPLLHECDLEETFEFGLDLILEGLKARVDRARTPS